MNRLMRLILAGTGVGGGASAPTFAEVLTGTYGASEVWPFVNTAVGRTLFAHVSPTRDGVFEGWDRQTTAGPVTGALAPYADAGAADRGSIWSTNGSTGFLDVVNGAEGGVVIFIKPTATTYTQSKHFIAIEDGSNSYIRMAFTADTNISLSFKATGGSNNVFTSTDYQGVTDWLMCAITWSQSNNQIKAFIYREGVGGGQIGVTATYTGTFATPRQINSCIGTHQFSATGSDQPIVGSLAYLAFRWGSRFSDADIAGIFAAASTSAPDSTPSRTKILFLGDSITVGQAATVYMHAWPTRIGRAISGGSSVIMRAVGGDSIVSDFADQVTSAASDTVDMIIVQLGTNDNNGGNMATLQAAAESGIATLKTDHPGATIYWMNVLPRWTDSTGVTEVDKSNIRTAVAAACTAQSITCWDTYTDPWIAASDTPDGLHPNEAGNVLIAAEVTALLSA